MRRICFLVALAMLFCVSLPLVPARAMPVMRDPGVAAPIVKVWGGCGPYGHRGPFGGCRPGGQWGGGGWGPRRYGWGGYGYRGGWRGGYRRGWRRW